MGSIGPYIRSGTLAMAFLPSHSSAIEQSKWQTARLPFQDDHRTWFDKNAPHPL